MDDLYRAGDTITLVVKGHKTDKPILKEDVPP